MNRYNIVLTSLRQLGVWIEALTVEDALEEAKYAFDGIELEDPNYEYEVVDIEYED